MARGERYVDGTYLDANPDWHESHADWKAARIARVLTEADIHPRSIADIGAGTGGVLHALAPYLPETSLVGFEMSPQAVAMERRRSHRVDLILGDFRSDPRTFDLVMAIDVFEHVEDYLGFLRDLHTKAPRAIFHIPLELSVYTVLRDRRTLLTSRARLGHLHHFTEQTALAALRGTDWQPRQVAFTQGIFAHDQLATLKRRLRWAPVAALSRVNESVAAKVAGGFGLMVLADHASLAE